MRAINVISEQSRSQTTQPLEKRAIEPKKVEEDAVRFTKSEVRAAPQADVRQPAKIAQAQPREIEPSEESDRSADSAKRDSEELDRTV